LLDNAYYRSTFLFAASAALEFSPVFIAGKRRKNPIVAHATWRNVERAPRVTGKKAKMQL
jgi:hypothetical protein